MMCIEIQHQQVIMWQNGWSFQSIFYNSGSLSVSKPMFDIPACNRVNTAELSLHERVHMQVYDEGCKPFHEKHYTIGALCLATVTTTSTSSPSLCIMVQRIATCFMAGYRLFG